MPAGAMPVPGMPLLPGMMPPFPSMPGVPGMPAMPMPGMPVFPGKLSDLYTMQIFMLWPCIQGLQDFNIFFSHIIKFSENYLFFFRNASGNASWFNVSTKS